MPDQDHAQQFTMLYTELVGWRNELERVWCRETAYPYTNEKSFLKSSSAGQCAVTSILLINRLPRLKALSPRIVLGSVSYVDSGDTAIDYHGWIELGDYEDPVIVDLTADQATLCGEKVICLRKSESHKHNIVFRGKKFLSHEVARGQEVWDRYIKLSQMLANSDTVSHTVPGIQTALDLTDITNNDIKNYITIRLEHATLADERLILNAALLCSQAHSFTDTRTYPRPDHPDPFKRRDPVYTLIAIITSLRTTLENEQLAVKRVLSELDSKEKVVAASIGEIERLIRPAGMARAKAKVIHNAISYLKYNYDLQWDFFQKSPLNEARNELLKLNGFGPKAVDCLLTIGLGRPSIAIDINVFRSISRILDMPWAESPNYNNKKQVLFVKNRLDAIIGNDAMLAQILHTLFLLHGKSVCKRMCSHSRSPIQDVCLHCKRRYEMDPWQKGLF